MKEQTMKVEKNKDFGSKLAFNGLSYIAMLFAMLFESRTDILHDLLGEHFIIFAVCFLTVFAVFFIFAFRFIGGVVISLLENTKKIVTVSVTIYALAIFIYVNYIFIKTFLAGSY